MRLKDIQVALLFAAGLFLAGCNNPDASAKSGSASQDAVPVPAPAPAQQSSAPSTPPPRSHSVTLPAGTVVTVRTGVTLSTKQTHTGDEFRATLAEPILSGQDVIAARGAEVTGMVADSDPGGRVKGRARIGLQVVSVSTVDGSRHITTNTFWEEARGTKKKDAAKVGIGSGVGAVIGAIAGGGRGAAIGAGAGAGAGGAYVLATRGDPAVVPAESVLRFRLEAPLSVEVR